jgi:ribosome maturation factor RimP
MGWAQPIFFCFVCFAGYAMNLGDLLQQALPGMGYELVDWETFPRTGLVRVFIDKPSGVDVEDCARVSNHLTRLFTVENVDFERLEVSSPGLDRPLRKPADFSRFSGEEVDMRVRVPVDNARRIKGILRGCENGMVAVETPNGVRSIAFDDIDKARLVPRIEWRKAT